MDLNSDPDFEKRLAYMTFLRDMHRAQGYLEASIETRFDICADLLQAVADDIVDAPPEMHLRKIYVRKIAKIMLDIESLSVRIKSRNP